MTRDALEYYDRVAKVYEKKLDNLFFKVYDTITWKSLEPILPRSTGSIALDVGGGTGRWSRRIASSGIEVVILDVSRNMLRQAKTKIAADSSKGQLALLRADARELPFPSNTFDMVLGEHCLHVIDNIERVISEMSRVAKSGGTVVVTTTGKYHKALVTLREDFAEGGSILRGNRLDPFYKNWLSPDEFASLIQRHGLVVERIIGKGFADLTLSENRIFRQTYSEDDFRTVLHFEESLSNKQDALGLAAHIQVIARKG